jgi:transposase-like protein
MQVCKFCGSEAFRKSGFVRGRQRYFCKSCERNYVVGDDREKYSESVKKTAVALYLEGCGFRRIGRILCKIYSVNIHYQLVIHWIKRLGLKVEEAVFGNGQLKKIPLLEMDELYTYIKKNGIRSEYGLLWIETGCVLLNLRSETAVPRR